MYVRNNNTINLIRRYVITDTIAKINFFIQNLEVEYVNGTKYLYFPDSWGYLDPKTRKYSGVFAELMNGNAELAGKITLYPIVQI